MGLGDDEGTKLGIGGQYPVEVKRLGRERRWLLPRDNPTVRACLRAWSRDPAWIYPAALVVLDGRELPDPHAGAAWRRR